MLKKSFFFFFILKACFFLSLSLFQKLKCLQKGGGGVEAPRARSHWSQEIRKRRLYHFHSVKIDSKRFCFLFDNTFGCIQSICSCCEQCTLSFDLSWLPYMCVKELVFYFLIEVFSSFLFSNTDCFYFFLGSNSKECCRLVAKAVF